MRQGQAPRAAMPSTQRTTRYTTQLSVTPAHTMHGAHAQLTKDECTCYFPACCQAEYALLDMHAGKTMAPGSAAINGGVKDVFGAAGQSSASLVPASRCALSA